MLYRGHNDRVAHECILDLRGLTKDSGVTVDDVAKRLIDYGFHAPTMSFPVAGTLMVEPTESEDLGELDRFCDAMIAIREEIRRVEAGEWTPEGSPLRGAPHTAASVITGAEERAYSAEVARVPGRPRPGQVLAAGRPDRPGLRRPQPGLRLPAARGVRLESGPLRPLPGGPRPLPGRPSAARRSSPACSTAPELAWSGTAGAATTTDTQYRIGSITKTHHGGAGAAVPRRRAARPRRPDRQAPAGDRLRLGHGAVAAGARLRHAERAGRPVVGALAGRPGRGAAGRATTGRAPSSGRGSTTTTATSATALLGAAVARLRDRPWSELVRGADPRPARDDAHVVPPRGAVRRRAAASTTSPAR